MGTTKTSDYFEYKNVNLYRIIFPGSTVITVRNVIILYTVRKSVKLY